MAGRVKVFPEPGIKVGVDFTRFQIINGSVRLIELGSGGGDAPF